MSRGLDSVAVLASVMEENRRSLGIIPEPCSRGCFRSIQSGVTLKHRGAQR
jgi:hypothetical protein